MLPVFNLIGADRALAAGNCQAGSGKICVKVYTDPKTGKLIITAKRNGSSSSPKPKPTYTPPPKPVVTLPPKPRVVTTKKYLPKPVVKLSLSDQLAQLIPMREIFHQPVSGALTQVPVNFWTTTPETFKTSVTMLGVPITVHLTPTYRWEFGDGSSQSSSARGAPYPSQEVLHTFKSAGIYTVSLIISWDGNWKASGVTSEVSGGAIVQRLSMTIEVITAPSKYLN